MICAWIADYLEKVNLHSIQSGFCPVCEARKASLGERFGTRYAQRDYSSYSERLNEVYDTGMDTRHRTEASAYLQAMGVRQTEAVFWSLESARLATAAAPKMLHTVYLGILLHMMKLIVLFLKQHKRLDRFDAIWIAVPAYAGILKFNKAYGAVSQWTGKEMRALGRILLPVFAAMLSNPTTTEKAIFRDAILASKR
jgi:hypothetical protein